MSNINKSTANNKKNSLWGRYAAVAAALVLLVGSVVGLAIGRQKQQAGISSAAPIADSKQQEENRPAVVDSHVKVDSPMIAPDAMEPDPLPPQEQPEKSQEPAAPTLIGEEAAKNIAVAHSLVSEDSLMGYKIELEWEHGRQVYDIDFHSGEYEYEYNVDAYTGEILSFEKEKEVPRATAKPAATQKPTGTQKPASNTYIGASAAKGKALSHAGVSASQIRDYDCELEKERGIMIYEIDFECNGYEYEYEIDAITGKILRSHKERDD